MKTRNLVWKAVTAGCALGAALTPLTAAVSDEEFNTLKEMVKQLANKVQALEQTHDQDQQAHRQDQEQIQQLKQQLGQTQMLATNAVQKAEAASQIQPIRPVAGGLAALHNFALAGDAEVQYGKFGNGHGGFALADFAPVFLYRANDNVLAEVGFDTVLSSNPSATLTFATLDYMANDYVTVVAGDMLLPLGTYNERGAGWLNKFPDAPLAYSPVTPAGLTLLPSSGMGVQLRGAVPIGDRGQSLSYSLYGVNGPSADYTQPGGAFADVNLNGSLGYPSMNAAPSAGGRVGWFVPLKPHYDLEVGVSGLSGARADYVPGVGVNPPAVPSSLRWSGLVFDGALHVGPYAEVKGEYMTTWVNSTDIGNYNARGWWVQAGYKLAGLNLELPLINNVEPVFRYDRVNDGQGTSMDRYSAGFVYYLTNTLLFEGDYEFAHNVPGQLGQGFILQLSYGF